MSGDDSTGDILLLDVTPLSLSIETMGGIATKMIEKTVNGLIHFMRFGEINSTDSLMTIKDGICTISNVPNISDIQITCKILEKITISRVTKVENHKKLKKNKKIF